MSPGQKPQVASQARAWGQPSGQNCRAHGTTRRSADCVVMSDFGPTLPPNFKHRQETAPAPKKVSTGNELRAFEASLLQGATPPRSLASNAAGSKVKAATDVREMPEPGPALGSLPAGTDVVVVMRMGPAVQIAMPICGFIDASALDE